MGSAVGTLLLSAALGVDLADETAVERLYASTTFLAVAIALGLVFSAVGGYVAARIATGSELNNAFATGIASAVLSLILSIGSQPALWAVVVGALLTVPAALAGGWVVARRH